MSNQFIPSGSTLLDCVLGGGYALGRIVQIAGLQSTGKTQLAISAASGFLNRYPEGKVWYLDAENAFDQDYAAALNMPVEKVEFLESIATVEDFCIALEERLEALSDDVPGLFVLDSLDALSTVTEMERTMKDSSGYGADKAKKLSEFFRRVTSKLATKNICLFIIHQLRQNITGYGQKNIKSGGNAASYYSSQSIMLTKLKNIEKTINGVAHTIAVRVKAFADKNKVGMPYKTCEFNIRFGKGIEDYKSCLDYLNENSKIELLGDLGTTVDPKTKKATVLKDAFRIVDRIKKLPKEEQSSAVQLIKATAKRVWNDVQEQLAAEDETEL